MASSVTRTNSGAAIIMIAAPYFLARLCCKKVVIASNVMARCYTLRRQLTDLKAAHRLCLARMSGNREIRQFASVWVMKCQDDMVSRNTCLNELVGDSLFGTIMLYP